MIGNTFLKKRGHNDKDRETLFANEECDTDEIKNASFLGILFSANWCPPCKSFLNILKDFYSEVNIDKKKCEILYVPSDKTEDEFKEHYSHRPWLTLPFKDPRINQLLYKYKVTGIPVLIIVDSQSGFLVTTRGRKDVHEQGVNCIPDWIKLLQLNREREIKR